MKHVMCELPLTTGARSRGWRLLRPSWSIALRVGDGLVDAIVWLDRGRVHGFSALAARELMPYKHPLLMSGVWAVEDIERDAAGLPVWRPVPLWRAVSPEARETFRQFLESTAPHIREETDV